jgi:hypothetical protein
LGQLEVLTGSDGALRLVQNVSLGNIDALGGVAASGGNIVIADNDSLQNFDGLQALSGDIKGGLYLEKNLSLTDLANVYGSLPSHSFPSKTISCLISVLRFSLGRRLTRFGCVFFPTINPFVLMMIVNHDRRVIFLFIPSGCGRI